MSNLYRLLFFLLSCSLHAQSVRDTLQTTMLQPADMQADFRYFRRLLEETHPGLYRYTPKAIMQAKLDSIDGTLTKLMPFYAFYQTIEALIIDIRCAHTHAFPTKEWRRGFDTWKTFPLFILPIQNRSYVLFNGTANPLIKPGFELLRINGRDMASIQQILYRYHWSDGYIQTSKEASMKGALFALFYYWFVEQPDTFQLSFRTLAGDTIQVDVPAQPFPTSLKGYIKNSVNKQMIAWYYQKNQKHPWRLSFPKDVAQTAYLRIDGFSGEGATSNETAVARFRVFMDKTMAKIEKQKARNLIIDLRDNPGGWDSQGIELFTYLMKSDSAAPYYARQHSVTDSSEFIQFSDLSEADRKNIKNELIPEPDGTFTLRQGDSGRGPKRYSPKPNRFRGKVYVLMNGQSASTTSEFLAVAHANKVGVFIGEESGGAYEGGNGGSFITLELPHSKIQVGTPLVYYNMAVGKTDARGRGTLPDYTVPISLKNILEHTDDQLDFVKKLIRTHLSSN
ncbi:S41 family peptidase [Spirosoma sp. RP8]|uniref:S41 family peptidase n=1 Tax=Spirosoma liriopis TaxID=2937440 RepID=A0ABT0HGY1_9BACT|nr:S41 family peptidase [Spirosoma liriopis]MCK8491400.1 S41 family peptidase [Spirosoma liriopis]